MHTSYVGWFLSSTGDRGLMEENKSAVQLKYSSCYSAVEAGKLSSSFLFATTSMNYFYSH